MELPDFFRILNQWAEKAFGKNAKSMIDSLIYAKLLPKLKRSVNNARLENGTYEEIVEHLEQQLELNALEESDVLPMATMASATASSCNLLSKGIDINKRAQCCHCRANVSFWKNCPHSKKKKEWNGVQKWQKTAASNIPAILNLWGKRSTLKKDVGTALAPIYTLKGLDLMIKPMMPQAKKEHPKRPIMLKRPPQVNQTQRSLIH